MRTSRPFKTRLQEVALAAALTAFTAPFTRAADPPKPDAHDAKPAAPTTSPAGEAKGKLIPELNFKDIALTDLIDFLRDVDPSFQAVIAYEPGTVRGEPTIQELRLRNVSLGAVLQLLAETYPQIKINASADNAGGGIWTIRVEPDPRVPSGAVGGGGGRELFGPSGVPGAPGGMEQMPAAVTVVHRLREIVDDIAPANGGDAERKKALESIVSLVQATLEATRDMSADVGVPAEGGVRRFKAVKSERKPEAQLKLHEGTETLIFHGSPEQSVLVAQALETLTPRATRDRGDAATKTQLRQLSADVRRLQQQVTGLQQSGGHDPMQAGSEGAPGLPGESIPGASGGPPAAGARPAPGAPGGEIPPGRSAPRK